jgi:HEAT repeat protein
MDVLLRSLNAADDKIKLAALEAMGAMGSKAQPAGDKIRSLMNGAAPLLATACAGCLAKIDVKDPQGLSRLLAALGDPDEEVRRAAVRLVGELTSRDIDALPQLMGSLGDPSAKVRAAAALAIARVKPDAVEAVEPLTPLLADSDPEVLINAAIALGTIGPPASAASSALQALGQHSDSRVVDISRAALQRIITQGGTKV